MADSKKINTKYIKGDCPVNMLAEVKSRAPKVFNSLKASLEDAEMQRLLDENAFDELYNYFSAVNKNRFTGGTLTQILLSAGINFLDYMKSIPEGAFGGGINYGITSVTLPEGVLKIGDYAFSDNETLKRVILPTSVTELGEGAFENCEALTQIRIPGDVAQLPTALFEGCTQLTTVDLPVSVVDIQDRVFNNCPKLKTIIYRGTFENLLAALDGASDVFNGVDFSLQIHCADGEYTFEELAEARSERQDQYSQPEDDSPQLASSDLAAGSWYE